MASPVVADSVPDSDFEAVKRLFSYLVNSIDTASLLEGAVSQNLITSRQRAECDSEVDLKEKAETFVGYIQRAVNDNSDKLQSFIRILEETGQAHIAARLLEPHKPVTVYLVNDTDIDYQCKICTEPLLEPYLLIGCGHHLCQQCRDGLVSIGKLECPLCLEQDGPEADDREPDALTSAVLDKSLQRKVKYLKVRCSNYKEGCEWVGDLIDLHDHIDPGKEQCGIFCPFGCGKKSQLSKMRKHTCDCDKRTISCGKCGYHNTYAIVTEKHYPICPQSTTAIPGSQYQHNQAPIEFIIDDFSGKKQGNKKWLSPSFYTHSNGYKVCLEVHPNGYNTGKGSHLSVYTQLMKGQYDNGLTWPFEGDIQIELLSWKDESHHTDTICYNRYNHTVSRWNSYRLYFRKSATSFGHPQYLPHADLAPTTESVTKYLLSDFFKLRVSVAVYSTPPLPLTPAWQAGSLVTTGSVVGQFTISEYSKRKQFNNIYYSPPFTSQHGYKFCLKVYCNGYGSGKGSHVTITTVIMKGQHDRRLKWPFTGTIIVEVLNWLNDKEHCKKTFLIDKLDRVSRGHYGDDYGLYKFVSHSFLNSTDESTQYIHEDCICVRVHDTVNN